VVGVAGVAGVAALVGEVLIGVCDEEFVVRVEVGQFGVYTSKGSDV